MKIKTILSVVFVLLLGALALCGCEKTPVPPAETKAPVAEKVVIFENGQMYFNVVRQDNDDKKLIDASVRLRKALEEASGTEITLGNDFVRTGETPPEDTPEILIGITNRAASKAAYQALGTEGLHYSVTFDGKKLILTSTDFNGIDEVLNVFVEKCLSETVNGCLSLPVGLDIRGEYFMPVAEMLEKALGQEARVTIPGHYQRGGPPCPYDRVLATQFGTAAAELIANKQYGRMVAIQNGEIVSIPLEEAASKTKFLPTDHPLIKVARDIGISFGD